MVDLSISAAFQMERAALIKEIARNIAGTPPQPSQSAPQAQVPVGANAVPTATGVATAALAQAGFADAALAAEDGLSPPLPTALLAGLKTPQAALNQQGLAAYPPGTDAAVDVALAALSLTQTDTPDLQNTVSSGAMAGADTADTIIALLNAGPSAPQGLGEAGELAAAGLTSRAAGDGEASAFQTSNARRPQPDMAAGSRAAETATSPATGGTADAAASTLPVRSAAMEATETVVTRALLSLTDGVIADLPRSMQGEVGGIIASFILNAHFQPGWPPLRPIQDPEAKGLIMQLARETQLSKDDIAMLTYLANFGLNRKQLLRILKLVASATNRSKLLEILAELFSTLSALLGTMKAELEALVEDLREMRRQREARRERLTLR